MSEVKKNHTQGMVIKRFTRDGTNCLYIANEMSANEFVKTDWDANCEYINHCLNMHHEMLGALRATVDDLEWLCTMGKIPQEELESLQFVRSAIARAEKE